MASFDSFREWNIHVESAKSEAQLNHELSLLHVNIRSSIKYWDELGLKLKTAVVPFDVIILTEVNIDASRKCAFILAGYS